MANPNPDMSGLKYPPNKETIKKAVAKSLEVRAEKKTIRDRAKLWLQLAAQGNDRELLEQMGFEAPTQVDALLYDAIVKARKSKDAKDNIAVAKFMVDTSGEAPSKQELEVQGTLTPDQVKEMREIALENIDGSTKIIKELDKVTPKKRK